MRLTSRSKVSGSTFIAPWIKWAAAYPPAIVQLQDEGALEENRQHRSVQYLNNVLERIIGPSSAGSARVSIFAHSGELGVRLPAMKRLI